jgi:ketosteroid isomerase-like protein
VSQENVELLRRGVQAVNDRDLDGLLAMMDDDVKAVPIMAAMEGDYHGHDGIRRWWAGLLGAFPDFNAEVVEVRDLGDLIVAALRLRGRGAESDTPFDAAAWHVSQWRLKKCTLWRVYATEAEALEAAGLPEQSRGEFP